MSTHTIPSCALALTPETLSAWRDESLPRAEIERLAAHLASCPACRARLAQYDAIAAELRAQPIPAPDARLWATVHASTSGSAHSPRLAARPRTSAPRVWKGLAAVAAVLVLVAGFGQVLHLLTATRGPAPAVPTATTGPVPSLHWQPATFPAGFELAQAPSPSTPLFFVSRSISVSQADGNIAYACAVPQPGQGSLPLVWVTHDRAAHWTRLTDVPSESPIDFCGIESDAHNTQVVLVRLVREQDAHVEFWATFNGGHTWQRLPSAPQIKGMGDLTTIGATSYAVRTTDDQSHVVVSTDHLRTWTAIDADIIAPGNEPAGLWVNPDTGELLAMAVQPALPASVPSPTSLWDSHDAGRHWTRLPLPSMEALVAVGQLAAGKPWVLCATKAPIAVTPPPTPRILCSTDGGQTWLDEPWLIPSFSAADSIRLAGIGSDGALLAYSPRWDASHQRMVGYDLYRLSLGTRQWQALGPLPEPAVRYAPVAIGGVLWSLRSPQTLLDDTGIFAYPTSYGIFVAAYP